MIGTFPGDSKIVLLLDKKNHGALSQIGVKWENFKKLKFLQISLRSLSQTPLVLGKLLYLNIPPDRGPHSAAGCDQRKKGVLCELSR
jgi:hypothetical protein